MKFQKNLKFFEKVLKKVLTFSFRWYIIHIVRWGTQEQQKNFTNNKRGVAQLG